MSKYTRAFEVVPTPGVAKRLERSREIRNLIRPHHPRACNHAPAASSVMGTPRPACDQISHVGVKKRKSELGCILSKYRHIVKFCNGGILSQSEMPYQPSGPISVDQWRNMTTWRNM